MADSRDDTVLQRLRRRQREEEAEYVAALAALDRSAAQARPSPLSAEERTALDELNSNLAAVAGPAGLEAALARRALPSLLAALARQERFDAALVRLLNAWAERAAARDRRLDTLLAALVAYAQRVEPVMDARDQARVAEAPSEAQVQLQELEGRIEAFGTKLEGLLALRDRVEVLSEQLAALRSALGSQLPEAASATAERAASDAVYTAFENRFRGSREAIRSQQADYVALFRDQAPVVDLGCGRGEFLQALGEAGIAARGVEGNANAVRECREKGLAVTEADLVGFLRSLPEGSLGGVFAAQVVEHLPPEALVALLGEAHRVLRPGGLLVLETVNGACALAYFEVFIRDLSHQWPLHPDTLRFLAAAAGFGEARIEWRSPVREEVKLHTAPSGSLAPPVAQIFNENVVRLNALLFAPLDYALVARR